MIVRFWKWGLILTCFLSFSLAAQNIPLSYSGTARFIQSNKLDTATVSLLEEHFKKLNPKHYDSLKTTAFLSIEKKINRYKPGFQAYLYETLLITTYQYLGDLSLSQFYLSKQIALQQELGSIEPLIRSFSQLMYLQSDMDSSNKAIETSLKVINLLDSVEDKNLKAFIYRQLCGLYQHVGEPKRGLALCNTALKYMTKNDIQPYQGDVYESMALMKQTSGALIEEVIEIRKKGIEFALMNKDTFNLRTMYRNLARNYVTLNQPDSAQRYFDYTFEIYTRHPYFLGWIFDQIAYGRFLIAQNRWEEVPVLLDTLKVASQKVPENITSKREIADLQMRYYAATENYNAFETQLAIKDSLNKSIHEQSKITAREEMIAKYETQKKEAENQLLKAENQTRKYGILAFASISAMLGILVVLIIQRRRKDKKLYNQKQKVLSLEIQNALNQKKLIEVKSQTIKSDLDERIKQVMEQQIINADLLEIIEELRAGDESPLVKKKTAQMKTKLKEQLTLKVYEEIYDKIEELHPELLSFLRTQIGDDKEHEIATPVMYYLGYETGDIAKVLQRTEKAVRSIRYRVRKKLELSETEDLVEYLKGLSFDQS